MAMSIRLSLSRKSVLRWVERDQYEGGHHEPPPPPPPPPPPEKPPPPPPPLDDELWVALYDEMAESTVLLKSPTIEFT
jgi:hypothetical protein